MLHFIKRFKQIALVVIALIAAPVSAVNNVIDVLVVYTQSTADSYGGDPTTRINQLFQVTNQIYHDSGVDLEVRVAQTLKVHYTDENSAEEALHDITFNRNPAFNTVAAVRAQVNADMVVFYRSYKEIHGNCGLAWVGGVDTLGDFSDPQLKEFMYAHIAFDGCGDFMTAHELGHNMGLRHSHKQDGNGGTFSYALGHGEINRFTTIMAYQSAFNADYWDGKVYKFSSPGLSCKGSPCGVDRTDGINGADAVYTLNITGPQIAKFFTAQSSVNVTSSSSAAIPAPEKPLNSTSSFSSVTSSVSSSASKNEGGSGSGGGALMIFWFLVLSFLALIRK